jgi:excisionase family DNA binding protein
MDLITKNSEIFTSFLEKADEMDNALGGIIQNYRPLLSGEKYLTDRELSKTLNISRRTLQDYRTEGKIPYYLVGGKILYKESDIEKLLTENYYSKPDGF